MLRGLRGLKIVAAFQPLFDLFELRLPLAVPIYVRQDE